MRRSGRPQHRTAFEPLCDKYEVFAGNARMKAGKIAEFFNELSALIFQDMRENAREKLQNAISKGEAAGKRLLEDPSLPYTYIGDEVLTITREISHRPLFQGISDFRAELGEVFSFFQGLSEDIFGEEKAPKESLVLKRTADKVLDDLAFQGNILLFYLKGESQKLGSCLDEGQKAAFDAICGRMGDVIHLAHQARERKDAEKIVEALVDVYESVLKEADKLGDRGAAVKMIAEEIGKMGNQKLALLN